MAATSTAVDALVAAQNAFADLPMPAAHGEPRTSTLADLAAHHFDSLARLLDAYGRLPIAVELTGRHAAELDALLDKALGTPLTLVGEREPAEPGVDMSRPDDHGMLGHRHP